jgi:3' exoribonuclease, RNase T-like
MIIATSLTFEQLFIAIQDNEADDQKAIEWIKRNKNMNYFLDTEFIENGTTIDLISIALVAEDGRTLYLQHADCEFKYASDWVWRNVFPHLKDFDMRGTRSCQPKTDGMGTSNSGRCNSEPCCWSRRSEIRKDILAFCDVEKYGKPVFWGYYADYDWVAFCQIFGTMVNLPKDYPMYCRDIKQLCDDKGDPQLPPNANAVHNALSDAMWNKHAYEFLKVYELKR